MKELNGMPEKKRGLYRADTEHRLGRQASCVVNLELRWLVFGLLPHLHFDEAAKVRSLVKSMYEPRPP
jgi:hypothetical protein